MSEAVVEDASEPAQKQKPKLPFRKRRWWKILLAVLVVAVLAATLFLRKPSPVGHWNSADGLQSFRTTYGEAMKDMPRPADTLDIRTDFGFVRVYRYDGTGEAEQPLVLLPGRASASPVWADNMPTLLEIGDVYTMDLLGEPGMSVQEQPIDSDADQAAWLDQTLAGLPEDQFTVVGLSIGGWTATNLATREPDHIANLVLVEPVQVVSDIPFETAIRSIPAAFSWLPRSWRDSATAADTAKMAMPDATVQVYPDATHAINGEYPDELAADIAEFISSRM